MSPASLDSSALLRATFIGTAAQLAMVVSGHYVESIAQLFAAAGVTISLLAGVLYALFARRGTLGTAVLGGLIAGGACALLGIAVSYGLGDVEAMILAFGTASSAVTGALGGMLGYWFTSRAGKPA